MPISLLALDLDGTTLLPDRTIHPASADAIRRAALSGIHVVLASGRNAPSVRHYASLLGLTGATICCNGAHVLLSAEQELLHHSLEPELVSRLLGYAETHGLHAHLYSRNRLIFPRDSEWGDLYLHRVGGVQRELLGSQRVEELQVTKLMFVAEEPRIGKEFRSFASDRAYSGAQLTLSEPEYLEFLPRDANKGAALQSLASHLAIPRSEVAAIGDYLNDLEMLAWAGLGGAVANAADEVRACARVHVAANTEGGVAEFIDSYVLNQRE
ncbi:MAG: Cof-type HAD-IIB family hydrolase [Fimbriimonadaceae bacterium]|nr:HAD family phosphatase [Chthonomonadaceae bacterium]MCO5295296.1 Cof-type HAD-IIB family hydrolase [Fimbriimonadaceae bacterium]